MIDVVEIQDIRNRVKEEIGKDPLVDPDSWKLLGKKLPREIWSLFLDRDGAAKFLDELPSVFNAEDFQRDNQAHDTWEKIGNFYRNQGRVHEALMVYFALYDQLLIAQEKTGRWLQKATPLVWIGECYSMLKFPVLSKRFLMLSHCDDSISGKGNVSPGGTGVYFRMVWGRGLPDSELRRYAKEIYILYTERPEDCFYPESILQNLDKDWMTEIPSPSEAGVYIANTRYTSHLLNKLGDKTGKTLELLAEYILSCMPGCRTKMRQRTPSTDYDIVCSMDGFEIDFRSELGRYFICECKDWDKPADFSAMAKFARVVESTKLRFGILFSKMGISGENQTKNAEREQLKVFHDHGTIIAVIDIKDLEKVANGRNFIDLLRTKYERVCLDLTYSEDTKS